MTSEVPGSSWVCWRGPGGRSDAFGVVGAVLLLGCISARAPQPRLCGKPVPGELLQLNHGITEVRKDSKITKPPPRPFPTVRTDRGPKPANEPPRSSPRRSSGPCPALGRELQTPELETIRALIGREGSPCAPSWWRRGGTAPPIPALSPQLFVHPTPFPPPPLSSHLSTP